MTEPKDIAALIEKRYQAGVNYKRTQNLYDNWVEYEQFWEADQWPSPTPGTKNYPRPVLNHFAAIIEQKVAALIYELPEIYFDPVESFAPEWEGGDIPTSDTDKAEMLSLVADHQAEKVDLPSLLDEGCRSAAVLGNGIFFWPWDNSISASGKHWSFIGDIAGYVIDPVNFFPGDPYNPKIQSQPWIIHAERRPLEEVQTYYARFGPAASTLQPDAQKSETQVYGRQQHEQDDADYVNILHYWYKEIKQEEKEDPFIEEQRAYGEPEDERGPDDEPLEPETVFTTVLNYVVVSQGMVLREEEGIYEHGLYPYVSFPWYPKRNSFWGKSESVDILSPQKEFNRLSGISLLSAYTTGHPDLIINPDRVDEKDVDSSAPGGRIIRDNSPPGTTGVRYMDPPSPPRHIPREKEALIMGMKEAAGHHEAWTGQAPPGELNASAIIALQEAAGVRIRGIQRRLTTAMKETAQIWLAHWKEFYTEPRLFRTTVSRNEMAFVWFVGTDYEDMEFDVRVQAGSASPFSRTLAIANLDKLLDLQIIDPMLYLELLPRDMVPQADYILKRKQEEMEQQQEQQQQQGGEEVPPELLAALMQEGGAGPPPQGGAPPDQGMML